jgi:P27 family predicted phage terminase small subunit
MRGRKPKSGAQRALEGNPGKRPVNEDEPQHARLTTLFDTPPAELAGNLRAQAEWVRLAPMLRTARQITEADRGALLALCLEWARYLEAMSHVATLGMVVKAPSGYPITNPYLAIATKALANCNKLWPELGLTPSSRSRVRTTGSPEEGDDFAEFDEAPVLPTTETSH